MAKGYLRANPSSVASRSVCRSVNRNASLCTFRCVAWQKSRWRAPLTAPQTVFLLPQVNLGQRQPFRGCRVNSLNFTTTEALLKCTPALVITDQIAISRLWPCRGVQQSSYVATLPPGCACVCVRMCVFVQEHRHSGQLM